MNIPDAMIVPQISKNFFDRIHAMKFDRVRPLNRFIHFPAHEPMGFAGSTAKGMEISMPTDNSGPSSG
jgi:hypothetical protein